MIRVDDHPILFAAVLARITTHIEVVSVDGSHRSNKANAFRFSNVPYILNAGTTVVLNEFDSRTRFTDTTPCFDMYEVMREIHNMFYII